MKTCSTCTFRRDGNPWACVSAHTRAMEGEDHDTVQAVVEDWVQGGGPPQAGPLPCPAWRGEDSPHLVVRMTRPLEARPRNCRTCEFAGFAGDYGTLPTCDAAGVYEGEGQDYDAVQQAVDVWVQAGELGDCPQWRRHYLEPDCDTTPDNPGPAADCASLPSPPPQW